MIINIFAELIQNRFYAIHNKLLQARDGNGPDNSLFMKYVILFMPDSLLVLSIGIISSNKNCFKSVDLYDQLYTLLYNHLYIWRYMNDFLVLSCLSI